MQVEGSPLENNFSLQGFLVSFHECWKGMEGVYIFAGKTFSSKHIYIYIFADGKLKP